MRGRLLSLIVCPMHRKSAVSEQDPEAVVGVGGDRVV